MSYEDIKKIAISQVDVCNQISADIVDANNVNIPVEQLEHFINATRDLYKIQLALIKVMDLESLNLGDMIITDEKQLAFVKVGIHAAIEISKNPNI